MSNVELKLDCERSEYTNHRMTPIQYKEYCRQQRVKLIDSFFDCNKFQNVSIASVSFFLTDDHLPDNTVKKRRFGFSIPMGSYCINETAWRIHGNPVRFPSKEDEEINAEVFFHWNDAASWRYGSTDLNDGSTSEPCLYLTDAPPVASDGTSRYPTTGDVICFHPSHSVRGVKAIPWFLKQDYIDTVNAFLNRREIRLLRKTYTQNSIGQTHIDESILWSGCHYHEFEAFKKKSVIYTENRFGDKWQTEHDWEVRFFDDGVPNDWMFSCQDMDIPSKETSSADSFIKTGE